MDNPTFPIALAVLKSAKTANERIDALPLPMVFKGTLGTGGTISTLPTASSSNEGFVYIVITDGTYAGQTAKAGDTFVSDGSSWVLVPSADEEYALTLLTDVNISNPTDGQTLTYDALSGKWKNGSAVKTLTYTGNGQNTNEITFPETPKVILSIQGKYAAEGGWIFTDDIIWGVTEWGSQHLRAVSSALGGSVSEWNNQTEYDGNKLIITGANASNALNTADITYTVCYI